VPDSKTDSKNEPLYDDAFYAAWAEQVLADLQQLRAERHPDSRSGRKIRRFLERLGQ
jgi:hypothetical protein